MVIVNKLNYLQYWDKIDILGFDLLTIEILISIIKLNVIDEKHTNFFKYFTTYMLWIIKIVAGLSRTCSGIFDSL